MHPILRLAKETITNIFTDEKIIIPKGYEEKQGCFVTITKQGNLRGCIGYITTQKSLKETIQEAAKAAALHDPRFPPLQKEELKEISIEISILSRPEKIMSTNIIERIQAFEPGKTGLIIQKGWKSGLLLPQVFDENTTGEEALQMTCEKAGLPKNSWKKPNTTIHTFNATIYKE